MKTTVLCYKHMLTLRCFPDHNDKHVHCIMEFVLFTTDLLLLCIKHD